VSIVVLCDLSDKSVDYHQPMPRTSPRPQTQVRQDGPVVDLGSKGLRTKARILEEAERLMLEKGYDATTISDITEAAGIRRASFYTYFTSKQDVLMAIGHDAEEAGVVAAEGLRRLSSDSSVDEVAQWVDEYLAFWDEHGAFVYAAIQAAYADPELREWSLSAEMKGAQILGQALVKLRGGKRLPGIDPLVQGLAIQSMMERFWYHWRVAGAPVKQSAVARSIAQLIWASTHTG
jgi:AcrR family transcriptional regulator